MGDDRADAIAGALSAELDRLFAGITEAHVLEDGREVRPRAGGLPVAIRWSDGAIEVALSRWQQRLAVPSEDERETAVAEALDLVAAGLFGRARVVVRERGGVPVRWDVEFNMGMRWQPHATVYGSRRLGFWRPLSSQVLINAYAPPPGVHLAEDTASPVRPWDGLLHALSSADADAAPIPVDGELDLHPFSPKEVAPLVREYIEVCLDKNITQLRIVHGKGIGNLRRTVHALLDKHPAVASYRLGGMGEGSWGATLVELRPRSSQPP